MVRSHRTCALALGLAFAFAFALGACGASLPANAVRVHRVDIEGNRGVSDGAITSGLAMHGARGLIIKDYVELDEVSLSKDRERIVAYYRSRGYFSARVVRTDTIKRDDGMVQIRHHVDEGAPTRITAVAVDGVPAPLVADANDRLAVERGAIYRQDAYLRTKEALRGFLIARGHAHAQVTGEVRVAPERHAAHVRLTADAGPLVTFGSTSVRGLERLPESTVRARVAWDEGDRYDPVKVERTKGRLYQMGYLSSVSVDVPHEGRPETAVITIRAREARRHELELGGGVALDNANTLVRPRVGYEHRGFLHPLLTMRLDARPGIIVRGQGDAGQFAGEASAGLERIDLFAPRLRGAFTVTGQVSELETYSARAAGARVGLDRPFLSDRLIAGVGAAWRVFDFTRVSEAIGPEERMRVDLPVAAELGGLDTQLGILDQSIALDLRDVPLDARRGVYLELRAEEGQGLAGTSRAFVRLTPEARAYVSPLPRLVLAARVRYGSSVGTSPPITQRYFSGGASSHRGFTYRRLSPMSSGMTDDGDRIAIGGTTLLESSAEARLDVTKLWGSWLGVVAFVDAGDVTPEGAQPDPRDLHWAAGGGLRYDTLIGPVRLDVGYRLNRTQSDEPDPGNRVAVHLSLGEAF